MVIGTVGIVGAGTMGTGIAQVALAAGHDVRVFDASDDALDQARSRVADGLARRRSTAGRVPELLERLAVASSLEGLADGCDLVIEAALEDLEAKRAIFASLDASAGPGTILATNTSALSVAAIAAVSRHPERVIGLHFFNPAPVMPLVEVVVTPTSDPAAASTAMELMTTWGKTPVRCADSPGFIVNRVNRPFTIEALRMVEAGEADIAAIDAALRDGGFPMGPFELMDLIGIDVNLAAARGVWDGLGRPDRLRPSPLQESLVAAGHLGRKTAQGFYRYDAEGVALGPSEGFLRTGAPLEPDAILARIRGGVEAEASRAAAEGIATPDAIALALRLGAGHPQGPTPRTISA